MFSSVIALTLLQVLFLDFSCQLVNPEPKGDKSTETSEEESHLDWDVFCKYQPNQYDCAAKGISLPRFYFDVKMDDCKTASVGDCHHHNKNQFRTRSECQERCQDNGQHLIKANISAYIYCRLQPDFGNCNEYYPLWYFDVSLRTCRGFSYSGCGGNPNKFASAQTCSSVCGSIVKYD